MSIVYHVTGTMSRGSGKKVENEVGSDRGSLNRSGDIADWNAVGRLMKDCGLAEMWTEMDDVVAPIRDLMLRVGRKKWRKFHEGELEEALAEFVGRLVAYCASRPDVDCASMMRKSCEVGRWTRPKDGKGKRELWKTAMLGAICSRAGAVEVGLWDDSVLMALMMSAARELADDEGIWLEREVIRRWLPRFGRQAG